MNQAWSPWCHSLNASSNSTLKNLQISYDINLDLLRRFFNWILIEKSLNFIWMQPGAIEAILQLSLIPISIWYEGMYIGSYTTDIDKTWRLRTQNPETGWPSSWTHSLIDSQLKDAQISYESSLEPLKSFSNWFLIDESSNFIWIQPEALEAIPQLIFNWKIVIFHVNPAWSSWCPL